MAWVKCKGGQTMNEDESPLLLPRPDHGLQDSTLCKIRHRVSNHRDRENPEVPHARNQRGRTGPETDESGESSLGNAAPISSETGPRSELPDVGCYFSDGPHGARPEVNLRPAFNPRHLRPSPTFADSASGF